jgi:protein phosphatase 2C
MPSDGDGDAPAAETAPSSVPPWGDCPTLYLSYGIASLQGRLPELTDALAAVPSFTTLSPPLGLDYFGVFDGHFGAAVANRLSERLHGAISEQIESELSALFPRFLHGSRGDVEGWWREAIADAFLAVDEEVLMRGSATGTAAAGATALVALVLKDYLVLANCGVSRAVISRGGEAVQLTAEHRVITRTISWTMFINFNIIGSSFFIQSFQTRRRKSGFMRKAFFFFFISCLLYVSYLDMRFVSCESFLTTCDC